MVIDIYLVFPLIWDLSATAIHVIGNVFLQTCKITF